MDDILNQIIKIETSVQELIEDAKKRQLEIPAKIKEITETKRKEYMEKADKKIAAVRLEEARAAEISAEKIDLVNKERIMRFNRMCEEQKAGWVDAIFNSIIKPSEA